MEARILLVSSGIPHFKLWFSFFVFFSFSLFHFGPRSETHEDLVGFEPWFFRDSSPTLWRSPVWNLGSRAFDLAALSLIFGHSVLTASSLPYLCSSAAPLVNFSLCALCRLGKGLPSTSVLWPASAAVCSFPFDWSISSLLCGHVFRFVELSNFCSSIRQFALVPKRGRTSISAAAPSASQF